MRGAPEEKKPQKMVRSSIACTRCRRSKVKCVNDGPKAACKACSTSNRECVYPTQGSSTPAPKRSEASVGIKIEGDTGESKKRVRKIEDIGRRNSQRPGEDVLESPLLTKQVWNELYEIFKLHFSTEMPFLHPTTFRIQMRQAANPRESSSSAANIEEARVLLLGVLTLTARFHPVLVTHHSPNQEDPLAASEYYATALAAALGPTIRTISKPSLANIQALLMIGLYDWGQTRGMSAWLYVGLATRLAFPMGLAVEDDPDKLLSQDSSKSSLKPREDAIEKEVRRRTLWSCFIMDRMLSAGKERPTMINADMLRVRLPCSDDHFLFVRDVKTAYLKREEDNDGDSDEDSDGNSDEDNDPAIQDESASVNDEAVLSRYLRLIDIFGRLSTWSYAGGRRAPNELPPWDKKSKFRKLRKELRKFKKHLPSSLKYNHANLSAHIEKRNATTYASLHTLYCLCSIVLHREYIPYIPLRCEYPDGPLDPPTFPHETFGHQIPEGFWKESAATLMRASRDIIEIVQTCQENNALPESPQMGFAVWQAAFVCLYAGWFPHMDTRKYLVDENSNVPPNKHTGRTNQTQRILLEMGPRLKMVTAYLSNIDKMDRTFSQITTEFKKLRATGGGLEHYKIVEKELKEFGELKDPDQTSDAVDEGRSRASTNEISGHTDGEPMNGVETTKVETWAAVNNPKPPAKHPSPPVEVDHKKYTSPHPFGQPGGYSPNQPSNAPSLMSIGNASNGETTPGMRSPFSSNQYPYSAIQPNHAVHFPSAVGPTMAPPPPFQNEMPTPAQYLNSCDNMSMPPTLDLLWQDQSANSWDGTEVMQQNWFSHGYYSPPTYYPKEPQAVQLGIQH